MLCTIFTMLQQLEHAQIALGHTVSHALMETN